MMKSYLIHLSAPPSTTQCSKNTVCLISIIYLIPFSMFNHNVHLTNWVKQEGQEIYDRLRPSPWPIVQWRCCCYLLVYKTIVDSWCDVDLRIPILTSSPPRSVLVFSGRPHHAQYLNSLWFYNIVPKSEGHSILPFIVFSSSRFSC